MMGMASAMPSPISNASDSTHIDSSMQWTAPKNWSFKRSSGIRIATFHPDLDTTSQVTLTYLPGMAGELGANLKRWLKQAHVSLATDEFQNFMENPEILENSSGEKLQVYDFSQSASPAGFIVVFYTRPKGNYFLKLTTDVPKAKSLKKDLLELALSLKERS